MGKNVKRLRVWTYEEFSYWDGFKARRVFRGVTYNISVKRVGRGNRVLLKVNGRHVPGDVVPFPTGDVKSVEVEAAVGEQ